RPSLIPSWVAQTFLSVAGTDKNVCATRRGRRQTKTRSLQRLQRPQPHGAEGRNEAADGAHDEHEDQAAQQHLEITGKPQDDRFTAAAWAAADDAGNGRTVESEVGENATERAAQDGNDHGFELEGQENLPAAIAHQPQDADVIAALA